MHGSRTRHRLERLGLAVGIVLAIAIVAAVINWVLQSDQGPLEPSPEATINVTIGPTGTPATATPEIIFDAEPAPEMGSMLHMLGYAPDRLEDDSLPLSDIAQYADIERWMNARGIDTPASPGDPAWDSWRAEVSALAIPEVLATRGTDDVWINTYGFGLHQVHQVLAVGSAPDYVMVLRGDFDADALSAAWAESGYQAVRVDGVTYWSLYPGDSVDLSAPASRPALGNMNNLVLLEDGTLIATARSGRLEQTLRAVSDAQPSLADNADLQALLAPGTDPHQFVSAVILKGSVLAPLAGTPVAGAIATPIAETPQVEMMIAGLQLPPAGDTPPRLVLVTRYDSAQAATTAYTRTHQELAMGTSTVTGLAFRERVTLTSMRVLATDDGGGLLIVQMHLAADDADWREIIEQRDLGYLMWPRVP